MESEYKNNILVFPVDYKGFCYIREIIIQLSSRFPLSIEDSIELINKSLNHTKIIGDDIFYHETPEAWAKHYYWFEDDCWWKKGDERVELGLQDLKPCRKDHYEVYEYWESRKIREEYIFFPKRIIEELLSFELIPNDYVKSWVVYANNYNLALEALHKFKGWYRYIEEG